MTPKIQGIDYNLLARLIAKEIIEYKANKKGYISQNEAYRMFGRVNVDTWKRQGRITGRMNGKKIEYKLKQLQSL